MAEIEIFGYVGDDLDGVTDTNVAEQMKTVASDEPLQVLLNSGGGSVFQGLTIYQSLVTHGGPVNIEVRGVAASIASVIAMAGDTITMHQSSRFMIHNALGPSAMAFGHSKDLREAAEDTLKTADLLDSISETAVDIYAARTKVDKSQLRKWMDEETWLTAQPALKHGFADEVIPSKALAARSITQPRADPIADEDELRKVADLCASLQLRTRSQSNAHALRLAKAKQKGVDNNVRAYTVRK